MNTPIQNHDPLIQYSLETQGEGRSPALFKARDKHSSQEVFFSTAEDAYEWMLSHQGWVLKRREIVTWTFPLEKIIEQECWIVVGK